MPKGEQDWYISGVFEMSFLNLNDTFGDYIDRAGLGVKVNDAEDALEPTDAHIDSHVVRHESGGADELTHNNLVINPDDHHAKTGDNEVYGLIQSDTAANQPAAGIAERYYFATDDAILYYDDASAWNKVAARDHNSLDNIGTDDHHAEIHAATHESGGADEVTHNNLAIASDDHHVKTGDNEVYGLIQSDTAANRPAAATAERYYFATDDAILYYDDASAWNKVAAKDHNSLDNIGTDDHHAEIHAATHESGGADELTHNNLAIGANDHHFAPLFTQVQDQKTSGTNGGTLGSTDTWLTRDLNTIITDEIGITLATNTITLPAGKYYFDACAPFNQTDVTIMRIQDITNAATVIRGPNRNFSDSNNDRGYQIVRGKASFSAEVDVELQYKVATARSNGLGDEVGDALTIDHETYADLVIWRMG